MSTMSTYTQDLAASTCSWRKGFIACGVERLGTVGSLETTHHLPQYLQAKRANDPTGGPSS